MPLNREKSVSAKYRIGVIGTGARGGYDLDNMHIDYNTYHTGNNSCYLMSLQGNSINYTTWQNTYHQDVNASFVNSAPTGIWTYLRPNTYESDMANRIVRTAGRVSRQSPALPGAFR